MTLSKTLVAVLCLGLLLVAVGCAGAGDQPQSKGSDYTAGTATDDVAQSGPLSPKATMHLADLKPAVVKPVNAATVKALPPQAKEAFDEAQKKIAADDMNGASALLERVIGFEPENPQARRALAMAYASLGDNGKAMDNIRPALAVWPDDVEAQLLYALLLSNERRYDEAIVALRTALVCSNAKPENAQAGEAMYQLAVLLERQGYWTASLEAYDTFDKWMNANAAVYAKRPALKALAVRPERLQTFRGELLVALHRYKEAIDPLQKSFEANRADMETARLLIEAQTGAKEFDKAEATLVSLAKEGSQAPQLTLLAVTLCRDSNDPKMPGRVFEAFKKKNAASPAMAIALARIAEQLKQADQAQAILGPINQAKPGDVMPASAMAGIFARQSKFDDAMKVLTAVVVQNPDAASQTVDGIKQVVAAHISDAAVAQFVASAKAAAEPQKHAMLYEAALLASQRGQADAATDLMTAAIDAKRDFLPAYEGLVNIYLDQDNFAKAESTILGVSSTPYFSKYLSGKIKLARNKIPEAISDLEASRAANKKFLPAYLALANAQARSRKPTAALAVLQSALDNELDDPRIYRSQFELYVSTRQLPDAERTRRAFLDRYPQDVQGLEMEAQLYLAMNRKDAALSIYGQMLKQSPDDVDLNLQVARAELSGVGLVSRREFDRGLSRLNAVLKADPRSEQALRLLAGLYAQPGWFDQVAVAWGRLHNEYPSKLEYAKAAAASLMLANKPAEALPILDKALAANPQDTELRQAKIGCMDKLGQVDQAAELLNKWMKEDTDKKNVPAYRNRLLRAYEHSKNPKYYAAAAKAIDEWLATADAQTRRSLASQKVHFYGLLKQYDPAAAFVESQIKVAASQPAEPPPPTPTPGAKPRTFSMSIRFALVSMLDDEKQYDKALTLLDGWIASAPEEAKNEYRLEKIGLLSWAGRTDACAAFAQECIDKDPKNFGFKAALLASLVQNKKYDTAVSYVQKWMPPLPATAPASGPATGPASMPASAPAADAAMGATLRSYHVRLLLLQDKFADALATADKYLAVTPDNPELLNQRATALQELGRGKESLTILEKLQAAAPNDAMAANNLGYFYAKEGVNLDKAERLLRRIVGPASRETAPETMDTLGYILYREGRFGEAAGVLREVVINQEPDEMEEMHPVIFDHAGDAYWRLGWTKEAINFWNQSLEQARKDKNPSREVKALLQSMPAKIKAAQSGKEPALEPVVQTTPTAAKSKP